MDFKGGISEDGRGSVTYVNGFDFKDVKRFYVIKNKRMGMVRAWHGHKKEGKYVFVVSGMARIGIKNMVSGKTKHVILEAKKPTVIYIPPGNYNGSESLQPNTRIIYFSTSTLEESKADDYREEVDKW